MPDQVKQAIERLSLEDKPQEARRNAQERVFRSGYMAPPEVNKALSRAEELLAQGHKAEAQEILKDMRRYAELNPRYWQTVLKSARNRHQATIALKHIITLRPRSEEAWLLLQQINPTAAEQLSEKMDYRLHGIPKRPPKPRRRTTWRLVLFALIALVLLTAFAFAVSTLIPIV